MSLNRWAGFHAYCEGGPVHGHTEAIPAHPDGSPVRLLVPLGDMYTAAPEEPIKVGYYLLEETEQGGCVWLWKGEWFGP